MELAREAGRLLRGYQERLDPATIRTKSSARDLVTEADLASEGLLRQGLERAFPGDAFFGEESADEAAGPPAGRAWCVDPLDGTVNFVHGLPLYAVSVALLEDGRPVVGVVHAPALDWSAVAVRGEGAFGEGRRLRVSPETRLDRALAATGFPYRRHELRNNNLGNFDAVFLKVRGLRRLGAAALDLAWTAAARLDVFWELHLSPWDVAAGGLLVLEAGGVVDTLRPGGDWVVERNLLAGPAALVEALRPLLEPPDPEDAAP